MPRRLDACINCGETREIAAYGLCFKCYRREERADDRQFTGVDQHNPGIRKEHKKLLRSFTAVMVGLSDLGVGAGDVARIRQIIDPYLEPIAKFLVSAPPPATTEPPVNGEQKSEKTFTVPKHLEQEETQNLEAK